MDKQKTLSIQLILISFYLLIILYSFEIKFIKILLGVICILFLPGYNFINLIKPKSNFFKRLGYITITSLAIENITMIFIYLFFKGYSHNSQVFFFNEKILIITIQAITIVLITLNRFVKFENFQEKNDLMLKNYSENPKGRLKDNRFNIVRLRGYIESLDLKILFFSIVFIFSLILLCLSTYICRIPRDGFSKIKKDYRMNFTFFYRVSFIFYIFLITSILSLTYIMFYSENKYIILLYLSAFMYTLWILPYLQIFNYFGGDSYKLFETYNAYKKVGITSYPERNFIIIGHGFRYSTSTFTAILLIASTDTDINFVLWFLYPLIFIFCPFFFYSIFEEFAEITKSKKLDILILTLMSLLTVQFAKTAHSATTMVLGMYIFIQLVVEFYKFIHETKFRSKLRIFLLIIFLYFFLCLTHFEECVYFLLIIIFYYVYFLTIEMFNTNSRVLAVMKMKRSNKDFNSHLIRNTNSYQNYSNKFMKRTIIVFYLLLVINLLIFYLTLEFFGAIHFYFFKIAGNNVHLKEIYEIYKKSKIGIKPFFNGQYRFSIIVILFLIFLPCVFAFSFYHFFYKILMFLNRIYSLIIVILKKPFKFLIQLISKRIFLFLIIPICFSFIFLIHFFYYPFLQERGLLLLFEIILNYIIIIFHVYLIIKGILYYRSENHKQNYFIISLFASAFIMILCFISNNIKLTFHIFNARFIPTLIIFNLIIIQNTYFKELMKKKKIYLILMVISILFLGTYMSLNKIGWE